MAAAGLTRYLPTGAVAVIHYTGGQALKPAFDQSALGQIFNDPQMQIRQPKQAVYQAFKVATNAPRSDVNQRVCPVVGRQGERVRSLRGRQAPTCHVCAIEVAVRKARALFEEAMRGDASVSKRTVNGNEIAILSAKQQQAIAKDIYVFASGASAMDAMLERIDADAAPETVTPPSVGCWSGHRVGGCGHFASVAEGAGEPDGDGSRGPV